MKALEQLFTLEVEFFRRLRTQAPGLVDFRSPHTSYALQLGYEYLIGAIGYASMSDIDTLRNRLVLESDPRDVLNACDSLVTILGIDASSGQAL
jgi:hypothetical protein